jgi:hypothetical protein
MDPSTGIWARALDSIKEWPLWLLVAIAVSLTVLVAVPDFRNLASPTTTTVLIYCTIVAWIFVCARAARPGTEALLTYLRYRERSRCFLVTPIDQQSHWGVSRQTDGSYVTQVAMHCMVKNRSTEPLHIMKARVIKPKIKGEVLAGLVVTRAANAAVYGTPHVSGNFIGAGQTLPVSCTLSVRGVPKQKPGPMRATIEIEDATGIEKGSKCYWFISGQALPRNRFHVYASSVAKSARSFCGVVGDCRVWSSRMLACQSGTVSKATCAHAVVPKSEPHGVIRSPHRRARAAATGLRCRAPWRS